MIWLVLGIVLGILLVRTLQTALIALAASLSRIDTALTDVVTECQLIVPALDGIPALAETQALVGAVPGLVERYVGALKPLL